MVLDQWYFSFPSRDSIGYCPLDGPYLKATCMSSTFFYRPVGFTSGALSFGAVAGDTRRLAGRPPRVVEPSNASLACCLVPRYFRSDSHGWFLRAGSLMSTQTQVAPPREEEGSLGVLAMTLTHRNEQMNFPNIWKILFLGLFSSLKERSTQGIRVWQHENTHFSERFCLQR